jgi:hypothetical protein
MKGKFLNNKRFNKNEKKIMHKEIVPKLRNCGTKTNFYTRRNVKGKSKQRLDNDAKLGLKEI